MEEVLTNHQNLSLTVKSGKLFVKDDLESYKELDLSKWVCVEILESSGCIIDKKISENINLESLETSEFYLSRDGIINYYKYLIPNLTEVLKDGKVPEYTLVYYNGEFYYSEYKILSLYGVENLKKLSIHDLYTTINCEFLNKNYIIYNIYTFVSYELIREKFLEIQNLCSEDTFHTSKIKTGDLFYLRNILLSGILAVKYYINNNSINEADSILKNLNNSNCLNLENDISYYPSNN